MHSTAESKVALGCFPYIAVYLFKSLRKQKTLHFCLISHVIVGEIDVTGRSERTANNASIILENNKFLKNKSLGD